MAGVLRQYQSEICGNYRKAYLRYGLFSGLIMSAYVLFMRIIILPVSTPTGYGTDIALLLCMLLFSYLYRRTLPDERVFFKELMLMNLGLGVVAAVVYGLFLLLYGQVFDTDFFTRCMDDFVRNAQNADKPAEDIRRMVEAYQNYRPWHWASIGAFRTAVMAIIEAFVAALVFRTEKNVVKAKPGK